jgi:hypothetical protein
MGYEGVWHSGKTPKMAKMGYYIIRKLYLHYFGVFLVSVTLLVAISLFPGKVITNMSRGHAARLI